MNSRTKVCSHTKGCGIEKDLSEFSKVGTKKSGTIQYKYICKECDRQQTKQWRQNNQDRKKEQDSQYRQNNVDKIKEINKRWYQNNQDREKENRRRYRQNNQEKEMLSSSKRRAHKKGLEHNIELEDILIPEYCPILKIKIENNSGKGFKTAQPNSASIDRIDNSKGYIKGNIRVISWRANHLKSDSTAEERKLLHEDDLTLEQQRQEKKEEIPHG